MRDKTQKVKICKICQTDFWNLTSNYCCTECRNEGNRRSSIKNQAKYREIKRIGKGAFLEKAGKI